jgi:hypothetical protein
MVALLDPYRIRHLVTDKETVEHASHLEYYEDEIASANEAMRSQVAHDTFDFRVSGIGGHERHLLPPCKGFEDELEWLGRVLRGGNVLVDPC